MATANETTTAAGQKEDKVERAQQVSSANEQASLVSGAIFRRGWQHSFRGAMLDVKLRKRHR